jgi:hypothetical protein
MEINYEDKEHKIKAIIFANGQVLTTKSKDELRTAANHLNKWAKIHHMKMSKTKTKAMGICGNNIQRVMIELDKK